MFWGTCKSVFGINAWPSEANCDIETAFATCMIWQRFHTAFFRSIRLVDPFFWGIKENI